MNNLSIEFYNLINGLFADYKFSCDKIIMGPDMWFLAVDILDLFGYSTTSCSQSEVLSKIQKENCKKLTELYDDIGIDILNQELSEDDPNHRSVNTLDNNAKKRVYINKIGLYELILNSRKPESRKFKMFIVNKVLPALDRHYLNLLKSKDEIISSNQKMLEEIRNIALEQGVVIRETRQIANDTNFKLENLTNYVKHDIIPNRNLSPSNKRHVHYIVLYKYLDEYIFVRGQKAHVDATLNRLEEAEVLIHSEYPNPIDLLSKFREHSIKVNTSIKRAIIKYVNECPKFSHKTEAEKRNNIRSCYRKKKIFEIKNNQLVLNSSSIEDVMNYYKELLEEREHIPDMN